MLGGKINLVIHESVEKQTDTKAGASKKCHVELETSKQRYTVLFNRSVNISRNTRIRLQGYIKQWLPYDRTSKYSASWQLKEFSTVRDYTCHFYRLIWCNPESLHANSAVYYSVVLINHLYRSLSKLRVCLKLLQHFFVFWNCLQKVLRC